MARFEPGPDYIRLAASIETQAHAIRTGAVSGSYTDAVRHLMIDVTRLVARTPDDRP